MKIALRLAWRSLLNRRLASILTILSVALSVALLIGVERVRQSARSSFINTISQTDLIVGARGGGIPLLLYTVFHMGNATNNISFATYEKISSDPNVAWTIPLSLGDSHRGFRVVGTNADFYAHYHYRRNQQPRFGAGAEPKAMFDVAVGSAVAAKLGYRIGDHLTLSHGVGEVSFHSHDDKPFSVTGILDPTGTPIDRSVFINLQGLEAIHADWEDGAPPLPEHAIKSADLQKRNLPVRELTAVLVGAKSRADSLGLQRQWSEFKGEPLSAIIPGLALDDLWEAISYAENGLRVVAIFVVVVGLLGLLVSIYNSLNERRREMAILRSVGAGPGLIFALMILEAVLLTVVGAASGVAFMYLLLFALSPLIELNFGLYLPISPLASTEQWYLVAIVGLSFILGAIPAWRAYRNTLSDGLTIRL
ncbi:MAG: ABC transporter permease [Proteobacteria bacterium]|nr:ABC transporter permease [Pseudomonadota bacterium]